MEMRGIGSPAVACNESRSTAVSRSRLSSLASVACSVSVACGSIETRLREAIANAD